jgi:hypothetical protein
MVAYGLTVSTQSFRFAQRALPELMVVENDSVTGAQVIHKIDPSVSRTTR